MMVTYEITDEVEMTALGERIAGVLHGGELLELIGDVGAGKTTLTRAILRARGITEAIQSPTFTICNRYATESLEFAHYDFYRLGEAGIMQEDFIETTQNPNCITIVEWGDIVSAGMPKDRLTIEIVPQGETRRRVTFKGHGTMHAIEASLV